MGLEIRPTETDEQEECTHISVSFTGRGAFLRKEDWRTGLKPRAFMWGSMKKAEHLVWRGARIRVTADFSGTMQA